MSARRALRLALLSFVPVSCGTGVPPAVTSSDLVLPGENPATPAARDSGAGPLSPLARELGRTRGLTFSQLPGLSELARAELVAVALDRVRAQTPERLRATAVRALVALELAPHDFDYFAALEHGLTERLQAFYDPERRIIFTDRGLGPDERERGVLHELVHAAQFAARSAGEADVVSDQRAALHTLAEGEATYLTERLRPASDFTPATALDPGDDAGVPPVLLCSLAAPYVDGRAIVTREYLAGGWAAIDALWASPPRSTHELLHPGAPRALVEIELPPAPDDRAWSLRGTDVLGEQALRCVLEQWWAEPEARRIASGWAGDRLAWFETGAEVALVWQLKLDGRARAEDALRAVRDGLRLANADVGQRAETRATEQACRAHRDSGVVGALSQAEHVWLLALHGLPTEVGCRRLTVWSARLASGQAQPSTRVEENSPVSIHP